MFLFVFTSWLLGSFWSQAGPRANINVSFIQDCSVYFMLAWLRVVKNQEAKDFKAFQKD